MAIENISSYEAVDPIPQKNTINKIAQEVDTKISELTQNNKGKTQKLTDEQGNDIQYYTDKNGSIYMTTYQGKEGPNTPYKHIRIDKNTNKSNGESYYMVYESQKDAIGSERMTHFGTTQNYITESDKISGKTKINMEDIQNTLNKVQNTIDENTTIVNREKSTQKLIAKQEQYNLADDYLESELDQMA